MVTFEEEEGDPVTPEPGDAGFEFEFDDGEVHESKGHGCKICIKAPRKNQQILHCCKCYDTYFKTCPVLTGKEIKDYDNLFRSWMKNKDNWDCLECRKKLKKMYCTVCQLDKDKILLECAWCKSKCHSDCAGNVKLGLSVSSTDWLCKACNKGDKRADWNDTGANYTEASALVGVKELESMLKTEFYPYEGVKILQLNIGAQRLHKVRHFLSHNEKFVDVFAIGETNLNKAHANVDYEVPGYEMVRADKKIPPAAAHKPKAPPTSGSSPQGNSQPLPGGLLFYVRKDWKVVSKNCDFFESTASSTGGGGTGHGTGAATENIYDTIEYLEVKIEKENKRLKGDSLVLLLVLIYSPKPANKAFLEKLEELLTTRIGKLKHISQIFLMGDIKINLLGNQSNPSPLSVNFKTIMSELGYKMLLDENEPTVATKKAAKLNHILYASEDVEELGVRGGVVYLDWSSHYLLYAVKKYYFKAMPTLEAKIIKALGFTNLSEHTTTKKERVIRAILDYAKAEAAKRAAEEEARNPKPKKDENQNDTANGGVKGSSSAEQNGVEGSSTAGVNGKENSISRVGSNKDLANGNGKLANGKGSQKGSKADLMAAAAQSKKPARRKRFKFLPVWCASIPESLVIS